MSPRVATIDFHVTSECSQECPYCWGPRDCETPVDTDTALRIVSRVKEVGARRIVFTGGDPLAREDLPELVERARQVGLEVALSTTGDRLTPTLLKRLAGSLDLISLPLDGSNEEINSRTKEPGHFRSILEVLDLLREYPAIDVKVCTPVTRRNLADVGNIHRLVEKYAETTRARVFYNVFQTFPRAMFDVEWESLVVSDEEFRALESDLASTRRVRVSFLDHGTLDRLYVMIFPDGRLVIPSGAEFGSFGPFLEVDDLDQVLERGRFDWRKHQRHSRGWARRSR